MFYSRCYLNMLFCQLPISPNKHHTKNSITTPAINIILLMPSREACSLIIVSVMHTTQYQDLAIVLQLCCKYNLVYSCRRWTSFQGEWVRCLNPVGELVSFWSLICIVSYENKYHTILLSEGACKLCTAYTIWGATIQICST